MLGSSKGGGSGPQQLMILIILLLLMIRAQELSYIQTGDILYIQIVHGRFIRVLLGRGSNNTVYTTSGACCVFTDCLHRSNSLILPIWLVFVISDQPMDRPTDGPTKWLIELCARD